MEDALVVILSRNEFYKRQYRLLLGTLFLTLLVIGVLTWILIYLIHNPPKPLYFAADKMGRLIEEKSLMQPNMTTQEVTAWVIEVVQSALSYDFVNYRSELQQAQKYFTSYGWQQYMDALNASNNLVALTSRKMVVMAQVVETPKIITEGQLSDSYAWKFQMPVLVTYWLPPFDDKSKFYNPLDVTVIVQRQPLLQSYKGLGILQLIGGLITTQPGGAEV